MLIVSPTTTKNPKNISTKKYHDNKVGKKHILGGDLRKVFVFYTIICHCAEGGGPLLGAGPPLIGSIGFY